MIVTLTLNPAVDRTVVVDSMALGQTNRVLDVHVAAGGKGVNVSRALIGWNTASAATGFLAGLEGEFIASALRESNIEPKFARLAGTSVTRTNTKIYDRSTRLTTELNEPGPEIARKDEEDLWQLLDGLLPETKILVCSGSLPQGTSPSFYHDLVQKCNRLGVLVCLDTSGPALAEGVKSGPYFIKPNQEELENLLQRKFTSELEIVEAIKDLAQFGISVITVSLGENGAIFYKQGQPIFWAGAAAEPLNSTTGCGDTLVAAMVFALAKEMGWEATVRWAAAAATATAELFGTDFPEPKHIENIIPRVNLRKIESV
ncbi:MAG: 1-phosphofructokinase family hexose kinase [Firmicutes bacterium]|nr:1-phosphofructokinase family hexose kinase [Bacillota bacterium]